MPKTRDRAAARVAEQLIPTEFAIDDAITNLATLANVMTTARRDAQLSVSQGQGALARVTNALKLISDARGEIAIAHNELLIVQDDLGLKEVSFGAMDGCHGSMVGRFAEVIPIRA
jgi:hypothetical protein